MKKEDKKYGGEVIDFKDMVKIFKKRKWYFIVTFLIVLILGVILTFLVSLDFQYKASTSITLSDDNLAKHKMISDYYPQESRDLWLFNEGKITNQYFKNYLYLITSDIESKEFLEEVIKKTNITLTAPKLNKLIHIEKTMDGNGLTISNFYRNANMAQEINQAVLDTYIEQRENAFDNIYENLVNKVEKDIEDLESNLDMLSLEAEEYSISFNKELINSIDVSEKAEIVLKASSFLPPDLENKINATTKKYNSLNEILKNLKDTRSLYTGRIEVISNPGVYQNFNYLRNILVVIIGAVIIGIILVYAVDFFASSKGKR